MSFKPLHKGSDKDSSPAKDSSPTKELHRAAASSEKRESPTKDQAGDQDKEEAKRRVRDDVHDEVNALLDGSDALQRSDFDGKARQFLHAIHNLRGREGVHEALHIISFTTAKKSRDSVRNWGGYISTLLQKYFQEIGGGKNQKTRESGREDKGDEKGEDKEHKDPPKTVEVKAALAGSLTASPVVFGRPQPRAKA